MSSLIPKDGPRRAASPPEAPTSRPAAHPEVRQMPPTAEPAPQRSRMKMALVGVLAVLYVVSPIDIVPEVLVPVIGWIDDILVLLAAFGFISHQSVRKIHPR